MKKFGVVIGILLLIALLGFGVKCQSDHSEALRARPNIVFIIIDCWRYDHFTAEITPTIWKLAQQGVAFEHHYANGGSTRSSMASIFSSQYPEFSEANSHLNGMSRFTTTYNQRKLENFPKKLQSFPEILKENGYQTIAITANPNSGIDGGYGPKQWTRLEELFSKTIEDEREGAATLVREGIRQLRVRNPRKPYLLFLHFMDSHYPYDLSHLSPDQRTLIDEYYATRNDPSAPRPKELIDPALNAYRNAISFIDAQLALLMDDVDLTKTVVVITADHGELFNEHGLISHLGHLRTEIVHIPLVVSGWKIAKSPNTTCLTQGVDLFPTILSVAGIEPPADIAGQDLFSAKFKPRKMIIASSYLDTAYITATEIKVIPFGTKKTENQAAEELKALGYLN